jgi:hypothetical protein
MAAEEVVQKSIAKTRGEILTTMMIELRFILSVVVNNHSHIRTAHNKRHRLP